MELTQGSETSANYNLTPGKYPKEHIQYSITHVSAISNSIFITLYAQNSYLFQLTSSFLQTDRLMRMWPCIIGWVVTVFTTIIMPSSPTAVQELTCWVLEDRGTLILQNIRNHSTNTTGSHPRGPESSATRLWEPHMSEYDTLGCHDFKMWGFTQITQQTGTQARILINNSKYRICSLWTSLFQNLQQELASAVW